MVSSNAPEEVVGDVGKVNVLVVNDDGITAPGLLKLVESLAATRQFDVYVAAPDAERSAEKRKARDPFDRSSHCISIHHAISAEPWDVPGAKRAFACSGTPADCTMIAKGVLYPRLDFEYVVSGVNRGDNAGLHVIYSGTVAGAREGAMRGNAVGVAVSLNSYSRSADYSEAGRLTAELLTAVAAIPGLKAELTGKVVNVNVPNLAKDDIKGVKLTHPGVSCTTPDWVRVAGDAAAAAATTDAAFGDGIAELPIPLDGALEDADWSEGKRWFRNKPGPARDDRRDGYDKRALDDGYVSVSVLGVQTLTTHVSGEGATGADMGQIMAAFGDAHCLRG